MDSITNEASVRDDGTNGPDPTPANNVAFDTDTLSAAPDLVILKTDGRTTAQPGQTLTYTLTISNVGNQGATGVTVTDTIPDNTTFVSASDGGTFAGGVVTWTIGSLAAGETVTRLVEVQVATAIPAGVTSITNTATATDDGANGVDPTPGDNTGTDTDTLIAAPDLVLVKDDGIVSVVAGQTVNYTLTFHNDGNQAATGVTLTDTLPANTTFVSASNGGLLSGNVVTWSIGSMPVGSIITRTVSVQVNDPLPAGVTSITNSATVTDDDANGPDPTPANNTDTDIDSLASTPDLVVTKTDGVNSTSPGSTLTYTVTISNAGAQDATGVTATDTLPANTTFVSASDGGIFADGVVTWSIGGLAARTSVTRTVIVLVNSTVAAGVNSLTNTASATDDGAGGPDPTPANNTDTDTDTLVANPDLAVTKTDGVTSTSVQPGQTVTYTLTISNIGNQGATGVTVSDALPANTTFVSASDGGAFNGGAVTWDIGNLAAGAVLTRTVTVVVNSVIPAGVTQIVNAASVQGDGTNGGDSNPANNTAVDIDTLVAAPDLVITKTDGLTSVVPGQTVTYALTVTNVGTQDATGVVVTDILPTGVGLLRQCLAAVASASGGVVTLDVGDLAAGASVTLFVTVRIDSTVPAGVTDITNEASVRDDGTNGADPTPLNNTASDTDTLVAAPDLKVTKTDGKGSAQPGQTLNYTVTISNAGNQAATGVILTDTLPANTTFVSASDGGVFAGGVVTWNIGSLAAGATLTRLVTVRVDTTVPAGVTSITNSATANDDGTNGTDPNPADNTGTDTDTLVAAPDLMVTKTDGVTSAQPGQTLIYTLTISNAGNQTATGVTATDAIPANTAFTSASDSGTFANGAVTWDIGTLAAGATVTRTVTVTVNSTVAAGVTTLTNAAAVSDDGANGPDPTPTNNTAFDTDTLVAAPDLVITKDDGLTVVEPGQTVTYTLLVSNVGNQDATGVTVTDVLPTGVGVFVASRGRVAANGVVTWDLGTLAAGTTQTLTVTVQVDNPVPAGVTSITNTATVSDDGTNGPDPTPANNTASDTDALVMTSLSGFVYRDYSVDGIRQPTGTNPETGIAGVTVTLSGNTNTGPVTLVTQTAADGSYSFTGLTSGSYTITEIQPPSVFVAGQAGYYDGLDTLGTVNRVLRGTAGGAVSNDVLLVTLGIGESGINYNFGENPPADPFGFVYVDENQNGVRDPGEPGIPGVAVTVSGTAFAGTPLAHPLTGADIPGGQLTTFTDASGQWRFPVLPPGVYSFVETQPAGYRDGGEQNGDPNPPFTVVVGNDRFDNVDLAPFPVRGPLNFGEILPVRPVPPVPPVAPLSPLPPLVPPGIDKSMFLSSTPAVASVPSGPQYVNSVAKLGVASPITSIGVAVGTDAGQPGLARLFDFRTATERVAVNPYPGFQGGIRVAAGDINGDGIDDLVTAPGPGSPPYIAAYSGATGQLLGVILAYAPGFTGGTNIAVGDIDGDGHADIVVSFDAGFYPVVEVFSGATGQMIRAFLAYPAGYMGGVRVAVGDVNGDGRADIVTVTDRGSLIGVFDGRTQANLSYFFAFQPSFMGVVNVTVADMNGDGIGEIVATATTGFGSFLSVSDLGGATVYTYLPLLLPPDMGLRVAGADINGDGATDLVFSTPAWSEVFIMSGRSITTPLDDFYAFGLPRTGGVFVG